MTTRPVGTSRTKTTRYPMQPLIDHLRIPEPSTEDYDHPTGDAALALLGHHPIDGPDRW